MTSPGHVVCERSNPPCIVQVHFSMQRVELGPPRSVFGFCTAGVKLEGVLASDWSGDGAVVGTRSEEVRAEPRRATPHYAAPRHATSTHDTCTISGLRMTHGVFVAVPCLIQSGYGGSG